MVEQGESLEARFAQDEANFVENMQKLRQRRGWSQGEFARQMQAAGWKSFHQTTVSRIEQGERPVRLGESRGIAEALGSSVSQMIRPGDGLETIRALEQNTERAKEIRTQIYELIPRLHAAQNSVRVHLDIVKAEQHNTGNNFSALLDRSTAVSKAKDVIDDSFIQDIIDDLRVRYGLDSEEG